MTQTEIAMHWRKCLIPHYSCSCKQFDNICKQPKFASTVNVMRAVCYYSDRADNGVAEPHTSFASATCASKIHAWTALAFGSTNYYFEINWYLKYISSIQCGRGPDARDGQITATEATKHCRLWHAKQIESWNKHPSRHTVRPHHFKREVIGLVVRCAAGWWAWCSVYPRRSCVLWMMFANLKLLFAKRPIIYDD